MLFYIDEKMTGAPRLDFNNRQNIFIALKELMRKLSEDQQPILYNAIHGNIITINNGLSFNEDFSIYEITDGITSVFTKLKKINGNTFEIIQDISNINQQDLIIRLPRLDIFIEKNSVNNTDNFYFDREMVLEFKDIPDSLNMIVRNNARFYTTANVTANASTVFGSKFSLFYNTTTIVFSFGIVNQSYRSMISCAALKNGFIEISPPAQTGAQSSPNVSLSAEHTISESKVNISQSASSPFLGVANYVSNDGYVFEFLAQVCGRVEDFTDGNPHLIKSNSNIVLIKINSDKLMGFFYD